MEKEATLTSIDDCWNRIGVWAGETRDCPHLDIYIHCHNCPAYHNSGRLFLDRPLPEGYESEWTRPYGKEKDVGETKLNTVFAFRAGREWLGLRSSLILEVVSMSTIHSMPHSRSAVIRGLTNIRGRLELCFSLGALLGIDRFQDSPEERNTRRYVAPERLIMAERNNFRMVFPVTEVLGPFRYSPDMVRCLPVTVSRAKAAFTYGIIHTESRDIGILRDDLLFDALAGGLA